MKMEFYRAVNSFIICGLIFMAISPPFVHSFRATGVSQEWKNVAEDTNTKVVQSSKMQRQQQRKIIMRDGTASYGVVENSARVVPTGPDPLHHNKNPIGP